MTIGTFDLEVVPTFPADVVATGGVKVTSTAGRFTFTLDYPTLVDNAGVVDPSRYTVALWSADAGRYEEARIDQIISQSIGEGRTPIGDAIYTVLNSDRTVALTATLTAIRNITLPAANSVPGGREIQFIDERGGLSTAFYWNFVPTGADTIGATVSTILAQPYGAIAFRSDGTSRWTVVKRARGLEFGLGSAALPPLFAAGDPNTGIFSPGADQLAITTGGATAVTFDATGFASFRAGATIPGALTGASATYSGNVTVSGTLTAAGTSALAVLNKSASAQSSALQGRTNNTLRWQAELGNTTAEGGANAGSDFALAAYSDAGALVGTALTITRSTLAATFGGALTVNGDFNFTGAAWTAYTPTVTSAGGTLTSVSATGFYKKLGRKVTFRATITLTTLGTGTGALIVTLPFASAAVTPCYGANGSSVALSCLTNQSTASSVSALKYDGTTALAGGTVYYISGTYESTT
jgi:hypothetical protein